MRGRSSLPDVERWIPIAGLIALVFASVIDARVRYLWVDEILTTTLISDPALSHMLHALRDQVDTSPPLYYAVAWGWARVFGATAYSLRILSALLAGAGFAFVWRLLRPYASVSIRAAVVCTTMLLPQVMLAQIAEARAYGFFIALAALTLLQLDAVARADPPRSRQLATLAIAQAALCLVHTFGLLYSAAALGALVVADLIRRRFRLATYVAWGSGWIAFLVWLPALRRQSDVGLPNFPIPRPTVADLPRALSLGLPAIASGLVILLLVLAVLVEARSVPPTEDEVRRARPDRLPLAAAAGAWIVVAIVIWAFSRIARPVFLPRYLVPVAAAYAVLGTFGIQALIDRARNRARREAVSRPHAPPVGSYRWLLAGVAVVGLWAPVLRADRLPVSLQPAGDSLDFQYRDLPIATISTHTYLPRVQYSTHPARYVFILDWQAATRPDAPVGPTEYKLMAAMGRNYPSHQIEESAAFLAEHSRFLVLDEAGLFWFSDRIRHSPDFNWRVINDREVCGAGLPEDRCALYLVERRPMSPASGDP